MLNRTNEMFTWNLPDHIDVSRMELHLQTVGFGAVAPHNGKLYYLRGNLGGIRNEQYMPTKFIFANPYLNWAGELEIDKECVIIPNTTTRMPLIPMLKYFATMQAQSELSLFLGNINARLTNAFTAGDNNDKLAVENMLKDLENGNLGVALGRNVLQELRTVPYGGQTGVITDIIELIQYTKASMLNYVGLDANYNMKRESLSMAESQMNADALMTLPDNMLKCRKTACDKINELFSDVLEEEVTVELSGVWGRNEKAEEIALENANEEEETPEEEPEEKNEEDGKEKNENEPD